MRELFGRITRRASRGQPIKVILWGKPDCSLCDKAQGVLDRLAHEYPLRVEKQDITADAAAYERYRYLIPVVEIGGGPRFEGKISEHRLRQAIEQLLTWAANPASDSTSAPDGGSDAPRRGSPSGPD